MAPPAPRPRPQLSHAPCSLQAVGAGKQAQVTVACDCVVFDWLLQHAKAVHLGDSRYEAPTLTLDLSVPLLAAAGYLQAGSQPASRCCGAVWIMHRQCRSILTPAGIRPGGGSFLVHVGNQPSTRDEKRRLRREAEPAPPICCPPPPADARRDR